MDINQEEWEARLGSNLSRVCRLCLKTCENVHPIFSSEDTDVQTLSHKIMSCAQVKVFEGDGLPTHVCNSCYCQVERSYQFKLLCERSDNKLRGSTVNMAESLSMEVEDSDEVDMTQLTPEVIIDEGPSSDHQDLQDEGSEEEPQRDVYSRIMHSALSKAESAAASAHSQSSADKKQPVYLKGIPGFVHSNQEMAKLAVAMALHQRSLEEHERKAKEKQIQLQMEFQMKRQQLLSKQKRTEVGPQHESPSVIQSPKPQRCRNGVKAFKCTQCSKSYSYSSALSRHKAVHNPQLRPHFCTLCNKGFTQMEKLLRHRRSHPVDSESILKEMAYDIRNPTYFLPGLPHPSMIAQMTSQTVDKIFQPSQQSCSINSPLSRSGSIEISIKPDIYPYSDYEDEIETSERVERDEVDGCVATSLNLKTTLNVQNELSEYDDVEIKEEPIGLSQRKDDYKSDSTYDSKVWSKGVRCRQRTESLDSSSHLNHNHLDKRVADSLEPGIDRKSLQSGCKNSEQNDQSKSECDIKPPLHPFSDSDSDPETKDKNHLSISLSKAGEKRIVTESFDDVKTKQELLDLEDKSYDEETQSRNDKMKSTEDKLTYPPPTGKGKPEFRCLVCLKCFATRGSLEVHSNIHTGVRPFVCKICQQAFRHKVNLTEHFQRKHSQVRPYHCDVCASRFVTKQELLRHYRKHIIE